MPGPTTEVLNEDVREIRGNLGVVKADLHALGLDVAGLKAEFGVFKWLLGLTLAASLSGVGISIWWAATLTSEVRHLAAAVARLTPPAPAPNPRAN